MLRELHIENLAVIEKAAISLSSGLNVLTGETGAGKSILIGGINAILGARVNKDMVRFGASKAVVTAFFDTVTKEAAAVLEQNGCTYESDELVLQREIFSDGKSVARIGGKPVTASVLREIAMLLVNIHGQHDTRMLQDPQAQRELLDNYGGLSELLEEYAECFRSFSSLAKEIREQAKKAEQDTSRAEFLRERIADVKQYRLKPGEEEKTQQLLRKLQTATEVKAAFDSALYCISGSDDSLGAYSLISRALEQMDVLEPILKNGSELKERLQSALIEVEDIGSELERATLEDGDHGPSLQETEARMSDLLMLKRRYGMDIDSLIQKVDEWEQELYLLDHADDILNDLLKKKSELAQRIKEYCANITQKRTQAAKELADKIKEQLEYLDMPNVQLLFSVTQDKVTVTGMDRVEMLISVNKGEEPKPVAKIASGGELSRIMLAVKSVLSRQDEVPSMVFDEIDTGISGRAAKKVGIKMLEISKSSQVLCVTHLAQIAALADHHLFIDKQVVGERTFTTVQPLDYEGRKKELARIISGDSANEISLKNAEELMANKYKDLS